MPAEERAEPRRQEGETDSRDGGGTGVVREPAREPVGGEARRGEREEDEEVVGGMEAEIDKTVKGRASGRKVCGRFQRGPFTRN